jgi:hypothetical protein
MTYKMRIKRAWLHIKSNKLAFSGLACAAIVLVLMIGNGDMSSLLAFGAGAGATFLSLKVSGRLV